MSSLPTDLITARRAAHVLAVHITTIYRYVQSGKLRGYRRAGERWLVSEAEVRSLVQLASEARDVRRSG